MKPLALSLVLLASSPPAFAAGDSSSWFKSLYKALTSDTAQRYASRGAKLTAVAAVRGAPLGQQDPAEPYWKGGVSEEAAKRLSKEREAFASAVQLAVDGKNDEAKAALEKFQKDHPKSALLPDVKETLAKLAEAGPSAAPAEGCSGETPKGDEEGCSQAAAAPAESSKK